MRTQGFDSLISGDPSLLELVEQATVDAHRRWCALGGRDWSEPLAYRWLRYEDPDPVARLADGLARLCAAGVEVDAALAHRALDAARKLGHGC